MENAAENMSANVNSLNPNKWIELYADYLFNYAIVRVNDSDMAQDLVQDTFLSALKAQTGFRGDSSEKTWLVTIMKRKIIDHYRKNSTRGIQDSLDSMQVAANYDHFFDGDHGDHWNFDNVPQAWSEEQKELENKEFYQILNKCLSLLPEKWAAVFNMKNFDDCSAEDICKELNVTPSNYWVIMHRSKLQLRECMEKNWYGNKRNVKK